MKTHAHATPAAPSRQSAARVSSQPFFSSSSVKEAPAATPFFSPFVQRRMAVSQPGDPHEVEAERMADHVSAVIDRPFFSPPARPAAAASPAPSISRVADATADKEEECCPEPVGPAVQRSPLSNSGNDPETKEEDKAPPAAVVQRRASQSGSPSATRSAARAPMLHRSAARLSGSGLRGSQTLSRSASGGAAARSSPYRARGPPAPGSSFTSTLNQTRGGGAPLPSSLRACMGSAFGADFSGVRVHDSPTAHRLSTQISAQAFTRGSDIYFHRGLYQPESTAGRRLIAHELTHVVQQGQAGQVARASSDLQRFPFQEDINSVAEAAIPGYALACVVCGYNPILGVDVPRTAANFFRGAAGLIPGGTLLFDKLNEHGAVEQVFNWITENLAARNLGLARITAAFDQAWNEMDLARTDVVDFNIGVITRVFGAVLRDVMDFLSAAVNQVITILKGLAVRAVRALFAGHADGYDLICQILGSDPLTGEPRIWDTVTFLRTALRVFGFSAHLAKLEETGQLESAAAWLDTQVALLVGAFTGLTTGMGLLWDSLGLETLLHPLDLLNNTLGMVVTFVGTLLTFAGNVASKVLELVKAALLALLRRYAHRIPGYRLLTVCLGSDPVSSEEVPRTAANFIHGFLDFVPGGEEIWQNLQAGNAVEKAMEWLSLQVAELGLSPELIVTRFTTLWNSFSIEDLFDPLAAFGRVAETFLGFVANVLTLAGRIAVKLLEILFQCVMGAGGDKVLSIIQRAGDAFNTIVNDPIAFVGHLIGAVNKGFAQFGANIWQHLKSGLIGWLVGTLGSAGIQLPEQFDLRGILSLALQILGLTYQNIRPRLVEQLGEPTVARVEQAVEFVRLLVTEGLGAAWQKFIEFVSDTLPSMIMDGIKGFVVEKIVKAAVLRLATMFNPAGAVIQAILAIYNTVMFFIERVNQILDVVNSVVDSIATIAAGQVDAAASFVEQTMARTIPVLLSFLARLLGLDGISDKIREVIQKIQAPINKALDAIIGWIVKQGRALLMGNKPDAATAASPTEDSPQSEAVKAEAQRRLLARLPHDDDSAHVARVVAEVAEELRPAGLQSLTIQHDEGQNLRIVAVASPPRDLLKLVKRSLTNDSADATVRSQVTLAVDAPAAGAGVALDTVQIVGIPGLPGETMLDQELEGVRNSAVGVVGGSLVSQQRPRVEQSRSGRSAQPGDPAFVRMDPQLEADKRKAYRGTSGGALFIEPHRPEIRLVTWNTTGNDDNLSHAEAQFVYWFGQQPEDWRKRVSSVQIANEPMSPCDACSRMLAKFHDDLAPKREAQSLKLHTAISWTEVYRETTASGLGLMANKWKMFGPRPSGAVARGLEKQFGGDSRGRGQLKADEGPIKESDLINNPAKYEIVPEALPAPPTGPTRSVIRRGK